MTSKKLSQFPNLVQVGSPTSPGFVGMITSFAGSAIPNGWALCNGSPLDKTTYAQLFARIGATWDQKRNQETGANYLSPGGNLFRLPDLRGTFLRSAGQSLGYDSTDLGITYDDKTAKNGLYNSASSISGTTGASAVSGTVGAGDGAHNHTIAGYSEGAGGKFPSGYSSMSGNPSASYAEYSGVNGGAGTASGVMSTQSGHNHSYALTASGQNINSGSAAAQDVASNDGETRPVCTGVNYLIKLYDDAGAIVMSGSPFVGSNFSEDYATQIDNFTAEINKAYTVNKATAVAVTLPAATIGAVINFKNIGVGIATITKAGSDTIDGATSIALAQYQAIKLKCFAANLWGVY